MLQRRAGLRLVRIKVEIELNRLRSKGLVDEDEPAWKKQPLIVYEQSSRDI